MFINEVTESERVLKLPIVDSLAYHRWGGVKIGSTYSVDSLDLTVHDTIITLR